MDEVESSTDDDGDGSAAAVCDRDLDKPPLVGSRAIVDKINVT